MATLQKRIYDLTEAQELDYDLSIPVDKQGITQAKQLTLSKLLRSGKVLTLDARGETSTRIDFSAHNVIDITIDVDCLVFFDNLPPLSTNYLIVRREQGAKVEFSGAGAFFGSFYQCRATEAFRIENIVSPYISPLRSRDNIRILAHEFESFGSITPSKIEYVIERGVCFFFAELQLHNLRTNDSVVGIIRGTPSRPLPKIETSMIPLSCCFLPTNETSSEEKQVFGYLTGTSNTQQGIVLTINLGNSSETEATVYLSGTYPIKD